MRTLNKALIGAWYAKNGTDGLSRMALRTHLSMSFLDKFFRLKYDRLPKTMTMHIIADGMKMSIDEVFPPKLPSKGDVA